MPLRLNVDRSSPIPIYVQLVGQVRRAVEVGNLGPGQTLPTVRGLSEELALAPNTVVKAYGELQREGLVESRPGVGTVAAEGVAEVAKTRRWEAVFERLRVLVRDAAALGITEDELWDVLGSEFGRLKRSR